MRKHGKKWSERRGLVKSYIESLVAGFQAKARAKGSLKTEAPRGDNQQVEVN